MPPKVVLSSSATGAKGWLRSTPADKLRKRSGGNLSVKPKQVVTCAAAAEDGENSAEGTIRFLLENNRTWAESMEKADPDVFRRIAKVQTPKFFWIGCADSRVPANQVLGLAPGEVFVQRNVGNLATHKDMNCMACLEFSVNGLKVEHVIVCGHRECGAVKAALTMPVTTPGLVNLWISDIRDTRNNHEAHLKELDMDARTNRLCEYNVVRQVFNVCTSPIVQAAWARGQRLAIHGLVYDTHNGRLKEITAPVTSMADVDKYSRQLEEDFDRERPRRMPGLSPIPKGTTNLLGEAINMHMSFEEDAARVDK